MREICMKDTLEWKLHTENIWSWIKLEWLASSLDRCVKVEKQLLEEEEELKVISHELVLRATEIKKER